MRIGIIGAGNVGGTLARKLATCGYDILLGVRDPHSSKAQTAQAPGIRLGSPEEATAYGEVVIVAIPLSAAGSLLPTLNLAGKIVIDTTNAFDGLPDGYSSAAAAITDWAKGAQVVKAFNATPWEALADPVYNGMTVETFICGDDAGKRVAAQLARDVRFIVVDVGGLANAALTENLAKLWGTIAYQGGAGRNFAFKMVRR